MLKPTAMIAPSEHACPLNEGSVLDVPRAGGVPFGLFPGHRLPHGAERGYRRETEMLA